MYSITPREVLAAMMAAAIVRVIRLSRCAWPFFMASSIMIFSRYGGSSQSNDVVIKSRMASAYFL
jgi:hypothetical protein